MRSADAECRVTADNLPTSWKTNFPSPSEIIAESFRRSGGQQIGDPDASLVRRRSCETSLFYEVERLHEFPIAEAGYPSIEAFIKHANSVLQRRKARSGRSLELHFKQVLEDCGLIEEANFSHQATTEGKKTPDFIFPNAAAYRDPKFPESQLLMLAAKTSCRDRWRQILNEADRVPAKHLLTLQEGVSEDQFNEMRAANVQLVVPKSVQTKYPPSIQAKLLSVDQFIDLVRKCEQY